MTKKVKLAIFDKDLKARSYKMYPVTDDGLKIRVKSGGKGNFKPTFDNDSFIDFPYRSLFSPWKISWKRVYFVSNGAKACVNFKTEKIPEFDPEAVMDAAGATMLKDLGKEKQDMTWQTWAQLAISVVILLYVMGVI